VPALGRSRNSLIGLPQAVEGPAQDTRRRCAFAPVLGAKSHRRERFATPSRVHGRGCTRDALYVYARSARALRLDLARRAWRTRRV